MKRNSKSASAGGVGVLGVIQIVFIILKLVGVISWSWGLVLIPLWISLGFLAIVIILVIFTVSYGVSKK